MSNPPAPTVPALRPLRRTGAPGPARILVVDDDPLVRRTIGRFVETSGYEPLLADGGPAALEIVAGGGADLAAVVLDLRMPGMDGVETCRRLRGLDPTVPVLLVSGYGADESTSALIESGDVAFLAKPFRYADFARALEAALPD